MSSTKRSSATNSSGSNLGSQGAGQSKEASGAALGGGQQVKDGAGAGGGPPLPYPPPLSSSLDSLASATGSIHPSSSIEQLHVPPTSSSPNIQVSNTIHFKDTPHSGTALFVLNEILIF